MNYLTSHWSFDPLLVAVLITIGAHEAGLARLTKRSLASRQALRRRHALAFYAGLVLLLICVDSPLDYWASSYFFVHMIVHLFLAFFAPMLIVYGAPWIPLAFALPVAARRRAGRFLLIGPASRVLRPIGRVLRHRWTALIAINVTMVLWHVPTLFDFGERNQTAHVWLMHSSFIVTGILFWLMIIPSRPLKANASLFFQAGALVSTNIVMFLLAMSLSIFSSHSWYSVYNDVAGVSFPPFADQELGAAILWVCGDFWAVPALIFVIRRLINEEGSVSSIVDQVLRRNSGPTVEDFHASRARQRANVRVDSALSDERLK